MAKIVFAEVSKQYRNAARPAVDAVSFDVSEGAICMLLGTSGSGKTTLLRMVNRLIEPSGGAILIDGNNILKENPITLRRHMGYVIQQVGLFPHMTIAENIRVTAEIAGGWTRTTMNQRVDELLDLVGLSPTEYRKRYPRQLSGGQQQRVGLARALATDPTILLMDEPFGALDAITRTRMQDELLHIQRGVRKTVLFVTHDVDEAFKLGDQIAVLSEGQLVQIGTPIELLTNPANDFVRELVGANNTLRQLQYLPAAIALEPESSSQPDTTQADLPVCPPGATLLDALLQLLQTHAPALIFNDETEQATSGLITLASIHHQITMVRTQSTEPVDRQAESRI